MYKHFIVSYARVFTSARGLAKTFTSRVYRTIIINYCYIILLCFDDGTARRAHVDWTECSEDERTSRHERHERGWSGVVRPRGAHMQGLKLILKMNKNRQRFLKIQTNITIENVYK